MARIPHLFSGKVGPVVLYERLGTPCIRSLAVRVRQSKATKKAASLFGRAASIGRVLRSGLTRILPDSKTRTIMYPLNRALLQWLKFTTLKGFETSPDAFNDLQFNPETNIIDRLNVPFTIDWKQQNQIVIKMTEADLFKTIRSPAGTVAIVLEFAVTGCNIAQTISSGNYFTSIRITADTPSLSSIELPFQLQPGCLTIVVAAMKYERIEKRSTRIVTNKKWLPAGIVGACYGKPE